MCSEALGAGQQILVSPLMNIEFLTMPTVDAHYQGLIFTSENGVMAYAKAQGRKDLPAYCVGERTAKAARDAGLQAKSANGSADELVAMVQADSHGDLLLHIRGAHTRGDVAGRFGAQVDEVVAYRQIAMPLNDVAQAALAAGRVMILPVFSPRTAQIFFKAAGRITAPLRIVAISQVVKEAILGSNPPENMIIHTAAAPNAEAMLKEIQRCIAA